VVVSMRGEVVRLIIDGVVEAFVSLMLHDDVVSTLRFKEVEVGRIIQALVAIASIP